MRIKRFEAESMQSALRQVREELGPDALVLETRRVRGDRGWFGLLGRSRVEVTAALDREPIPARREGRTRVEAHDSWRTLQLNRAVLAPVEEELRELRATLEAVRPVASAPTPLADEVAELRRVARALAARVDEADGDGPARAYRAAGLAPGLACELAADARERIDSGCAADQALVDALAERLEAKLDPPRDDRGHRLLIGPPGVGKTTTLAKEAGVRVDPEAQIVSADAHRAGGSEALRGLSRRLGIHFQVVASPDELARLARKPRARFLVDTPGACRRDEHALADLARFRHALGDRTEVQLVLSATTKEEDLRRQLQRYRALAPGALVFTKLDESGDLGNLVNVLLEDGTPGLAWVAHGQHIPDDLEAPDPHDLARRVLAVSP